LELPKVNKFELLEYISKLFCHNDPYRKLVVNNNFDFLVKTLLLAKLGSILLGPGLAHSSN